MTGVKSIGQYIDLPLADIEYKWDAKAALERVEASDAVFKNAFMAFDLDEQKYELLVADIIDGELKVVPEAIYEVAKQVLDEDVKLKKHLELYFYKIAKEFKDDDMWPDWELKTTFTGRTTTADGHSHSFLVFIDEETGLKATETGSGGDDGHTHTITGSGATGETNGHSHSISFVDSDKSGHDDDDDPEKGIQDLESIKDIEGVLKEKGFSRKDARTLVSKMKEFLNQCDADNKTVKKEDECDAGPIFDKLLFSIKDLTKLIKERNHA